jgi:hypothetical protein
MPATSPPPSPPPPLPPTSSLSSSQLHQQAIRHQERLQHDRRSPELRRIPSSSTTLSTVFPPPLQHPIPASVSFNGNSYNNLPSDIVARMRNLEPFSISSRRERGANITFRPPLPLPPPSPPPLQVMPHNQVAATHSALPSLSNFTVQSIVSFIFTLLCVYNILTFFYSQLHLELLPPLYSTCSCSSPFIFCCF